MASQPLPHHKKECKSGGEEELSDPEERRVLHAALNSFRQYRQAAHYNVTHLRRQYFYSLPAEHVDLLCEPPFSIPETFRAVDDAIDQNADLAETILEAGLSAFGVEPEDELWKGKATPNDMDKARSTLKQFYRDWSAEGAPERHAAYSPIFAALKKYLPQDPPNSGARRSVLVPGAGLGRLVVELCLRGYTVVGNELSYHQLLASNYVLNHSRTAGQHETYPFALGFSNHKTRANQLRSVAVPDIHPGSELRKAFAEDAAHDDSERMAMTMGDFCLLYKQPEYETSFDAIATCFFIDTAPNVIRYIEAIAHCLRPGGVWINIGPLLWHFEPSLTPAERQHLDHGSCEQHAASNNDEKEGIGEPGSFELTDDEIVALIAQCGFEILEHGEAPAGATGYIQDPESMLQSVYKPSFWVARKVN